MSASGKSWVAAHRRPNAWWLLALLSFVGLGAIIIGAWLANVTRDKWSDELWLEVAKAGVQVVAVGVLGGALTAIWRSISARRELDLERNDKIRDELLALVALYNGVKSVRRILRSLGLDLKTYSGGAIASGGTLLTNEQAQGFHAQMLNLNGLQLDFESKVKQFGQTDLLGGDTEKVVELLSRVENHLNGVLDLWETRGWMVQKGIPVQMVSDGLIGLFRVKDHLRPEVSDPMREITRLINKRVFGGASNQTQIVLARLVSEDQNRLDENELNPDNDQ